MSKRAFNKVMAGLDSARAYLNDTADKRAYRVHVPDTIDVIVGSTLNSSAAGSPTLKSDGTNWSVVLNEINAKRTADGAGASGRYYFGSTDDLERRITEHQRGDNHTTRRFGGTIEPVACRELPSIAGARKFEIALKRKKNPKLAVFMLQSPGRHGMGGRLARRGVADN